MPRARSWPSSTCVPDLLADEGFAEMFRGEAAVLGALDDANIVRLYEYVESPAGAAIVMELVDGVSLREILASAGATTAEAALVVLQGSLLGLDAAHRRGVVHRDYKPENVLVNGEGASKLTDFGIAARAGDRPVPAGTLQYASPEQMAGAPASPASDVYSATATFYECLTGSPPFTGGPVQLMYKHSAEPVPLEPVPEPLRPLVAAGMAKDPRSRPGDAGGFVTELRKVAGDAYGQNWAARGRSHLGEAALLLAALWPSAGAPASQGATVVRLSLRRRISSRAGQQLQRLGRVKAIVTAGAIAAVTIGTVIAVTTPHSNATSTRKLATQAALACSAPGLAEGNTTLAFEATGLSCAAGRHVVKSVLSAIGTTKVKWSPGAPWVKTHGFTCQSPGVSSNGTAPTLQPGAPVFCAKGAKKVRFSLPG